MRVASRHFFKRPDLIEPPDREWPCDGDGLERLGRQVGLPNVVLAPFVGAHNLLSIGYYGRPVEALSECVPDQGSRRSMVPVNPTVDVIQQLLPLFDQDTVL